jgi:sortase family protein
VVWWQSAVARWFSSVRPPTDRLRLGIGVGLIVIGILGVGTASWLYYDAWATEQTFLASPEAAEMQREVDAPTPIWVVPATPEPALSGAIAPVPTRDTAPAPLMGPIVEVTPTPIVTATVDQLSLESVDFRFLDPPQPGAHARVAVSVANHADVPSGRVLLGIDSSWFDNYGVIGTAPAVSQDRTDDSGLRTFSFPPVAPNSTANYELHVTATQEGTTPPAVSVMLDTGDSIGEVTKPKTFAPSPRPGPVMSLDIPRLKLHSGVLQVAWEPPPFAIGQIKDTANVTQGNTVLVGHLTGLAGNVFAHLDELQPGDEITAVSRGLPYKFVVSETFESANTDPSPMLPSSDGRLTLMTCAGIWNPFTHDYSKRLWVIAESPDAAAARISKMQATATVVSATATAEATADAESTATAIALEPTATPVPPPTPTPFAGEPSLSGGIGNTRSDLEHAFGYATGETAGKLVVFRQAGREEHVRFTPDPPRASLLSVVFQSPLAFDRAVVESRKLFPSDAAPRGDAPEGNPQFVVERFTSPHMATVLGLGSGDFSVVYTKDAKGQITGLVLAPGDDIDTILTDARK